MARPRLRLTVPPDARMQLRLAGVDDAQAIAGVHVRSWRVAYRGVIPDETLAGLDVAERASRWRSILAQPAQDVFLALEDDRVLGFCGLEPSRDPVHDPAAVAEISALYVDPPHWRQGAGRVLCTAALARARQRGFRDLVLWVLEENPPARRFYEAMGFVRDGDVALTRGFGAGVELAEIRYIEHLDRDEAGR